MKKFMDENFLLQTETAQKLYHEHAAKMPIIDYHCHLIPKMVADDYQFKSLTEIWLGGDHYKWRAMRTNGVDERFCTGKDTSDWEKFEKWAETVPYTFRNPLYHWTHLELKTAFGIDKILSPKTAREIYDECNEKLAQPEYSARGMMRRYHVEAVCTTDDPIDSLEYHIQTRESGFEIKMLPTWRPDKAMAVEVPAAMSIDECWQLVNTVEKTRKHCMMLENCCYDFFEMATLNMAQQGVFGEVIHGEGAYIHDLRSLNFYPSEKGGYQGMWRLKYNEEHTGNPYPTHGLGPICQIMNIHRGDKMNYLVSMSTKQVGMTEYAKETFGADSKEAKQTYKVGDMNTTLIQTEKGKTILIQHDVTSPRPYDRHHVVSGTKGFAQKYPVEGIALEPEAHEFLSKVQMDSIMALYEHPITKEVGEKARKVGGHGGMDFIMDYRLIYCLRNGLPLDQDVYDAAEWSCLTELTETSVKNGGAPVEIPDFTRGAWDKLKGLRFAE